MSKVLRVGTQEGTQAGYPGRVHAWVPDLASTPSRLGQVLIGSPRLAFGSPSALLYYILVIWEPKIGGRVDESRRDEDVVRDESNLRRVRVS